MAYQSVWYFSDLPKDAVDLIEKELTEESTISNDSWVSGLIWHYILKANRENFLFDLTDFDKDLIKYRTYNEGDYETWYCDAKPILDDENVRKLSFVVQLSDFNDYEGGNVQILDESGGKYFIPRKRGTVLVFDAMAKRRTYKITKGRRKALVGCCVGPQWS